MMKATALFFGLTASAVKTPQTSRRFTDHAIAGACVIRPLGLKALPDYPGALPLAAPPPPFCGVLSSSTWSCTL